MTPTRLKARPETTYITEPVYDSMHPRPLALAVLGRQLKLGPPSLAFLIQTLGMADVIKDFLVIVREFLPDREADIMSGGVDLEEFGRCFAERYFTLDLDGLLNQGLDDDEEMFGELIHRIPIIVDGLSYDRYEQEDWDLGYRMAFAIIANPYEVLQEHEVLQKGKPTPRVALFDSLQDSVDADVLKSLPAQGYGTRLLHKRLDGTKYEGLAMLADYIFSHTGTIVLDANYEDGMWYNDLEWSRENVERLTREEKIAVKYNEAMRLILTWLEAAPREHFREIVDAIQTWKPLPKVKAGKTLMEVFSGSQN